MRDVVIAAGVRTAIGKYGGALREVSAARLGAVVLNEAVRRAGISPDKVDDVITGQSYQNGECANAGRVALLAAGWPDTVPAVTLDRRCCSGLDAVFFAAAKIRAGFADVVVAAGMESMSGAELYIPGDIKWGLGGRIDPKWGFMPAGHGALSLGGIPLYDRIQRARVMSQPIERYGELNSMMTWAETAAQKEQIGRDAADRWALRSQKRAVAAIDNGLFAEEIVSVEVPQRKGGPVSFDIDETPRRASSLEKLAKLKPVYENGVCTAGNSSSENDGAAAVVVTAADFAEKNGLPVLARVATGALGAADPTLTYPAVATAVEKALARASLAVGDIDLWEIQEAFAVQMLADARLIGIPEADYDDKINVNGSGISLGHPIGATGVMRLVTLLHEMKRRKARYGLETICGGGGQGIAAVFVLV